MLDTLPAFGLGVLALLPGALYVWAFERQVGRWGIGPGGLLVRWDEVEYLEFIDA